MDEVFTHTKSQAGRRLFGIITPETQEIVTDTPAIRIVFDGEQLADPVIADLILHLGVPVNILSADVRMLNGSQYGQMLIALPDDPWIRKDAITYLKDKGLTVEEVHHQ